MTIFRDTSAFTTLDGANMGMREDFEKWFAGEYGVPQNCREFARAAYQFRQPEIDALKMELVDLRTELVRSGMERLALMTENERLLKECAT